MATRTEVAARKLREAWLVALVAKLAPEIEARAGLKMPAILISCGFPGGGKATRGAKAIGECWTPATKDAPAHIFVSPEISDPYHVAYIVAHEMLHAALPIGTAHKRPFQVAAAKLGHVAPFTESPSRQDQAPDFYSWAVPLVDRLPTYPHVALGVPAGRPKKQSTRMLKAECGECGYTVRLARKWLDEVGAPQCPTHGQMTCETPEGEGDETAANGHEQDDEGFDDFSE